MGTLRHYDLETLLVFALEPEKIFKNCSSNAKKPIVSLLPNCCCLDLDMFSVFTCYDLLVMSVKSF